MCNDVVDLTLCFNDRAMVHQLRKIKLKCTNSGCSWDDTGDLLEVYIRVT